MKWSAVWTSVATLVLLCVVGACTRSGPDMGPITRLNEKEGDAASYSWAYYTSVIADGDRVAVAWMNQNGLRNRNVVTRYSSDRGRTWSSEFVLNEPGYANTISVVPTLHRLPGKDGLLALWQARRNEAGQKFVLVRRSDDFGASWSEPMALNHRMQAFLPVFAQGDDGAIVVAWTDERNVFRDIYANRSLDGGKTWLDTDVRVSKLPRSQAGAPALAVGPGDAAALVWEERPQDQKFQGSPRLSRSVSADDGATWGPAAPVTDPGELPASPMWPQMVQSDGRLTLVWAGGISGEELRSWLWTSFSDDGGKTWSEASEINTGVTQPYFHLLAKGKHVFLVWHAAQGEEGGKIFWNASDDGGRSWRRPWAEAQRLDRSEEVSYHPRMALADDGDNLAVTWQEGGRRVVLSVSSDLGRTWRIADLTVVEEKEDSSLHNPQVAVTAEAAYVLWERWPNRKKYIKSFADVGKVLPKDDFVRRVDLLP